MVGQTLNMCLSRKMRGKMGKVRRAADNAKTGRGEEIEER
jgi:hypothetical protein